MECENANQPSLSNCFICYLCGDFFRRPRILPCGHTFCSECLAKLRDEIVHDGKQETDHVSKTGNGHAHYGNGSISKSPTPSTVSSYETASDNNGSLFANHNGTSITGVGGEYSKDRKPSSSCVDDVDNIIISESFTSSMSSSATFTCLKDGDINIIQETVTKRTPRKVCPRHKHKSASSERGPSVVMNKSTPTTPTRQCSQCGNIVTSQQNQKDFPIKRSSSMSSARDQSPVRRENHLLRWDNSSPQRRSTSHLHQAPACSFEQKHGREMEPFVCPIPQCNYSMRVMNLARWSPKNKALANALAAFQRQQTPTQDCGTQTDISNRQSVLVTIPRTLVNDASSSSSSLLSLPRRKRHSSMIDIAIDQAVSFDGPLQQPGYLPRGYYTWKSYAAMVGMNILQQVLNL